MPLPAVLTLALAAAPEPAIEWSAPPGCPGQAQVLEQARALIGDPTAAAAMQELTLRGVIEPDAAGFLLDIDVRTPSGATRKTARAEDCMVLAGVAALMVAVAVDPVQTTDTLELWPGPAAVPEPEPGPVIPEPIAPPVLEPRATEPAALAEVAATEVTPTARPRARSVRGFARISGSIGSGLVPDLDGSLAVGTGLLAARVRVELVAFHVFARDARYPAPASAGATIAAWGGSVRAGPRVRLGALELHALAGVSVAALTAAGFGARNQRDRADTWVALGLIPGVRWEPVPRVALGFDLEADAALRRPAFAVSGSPELHRAASLGLRGSVVLELRWGGGGAG